MLHLKDLQLQYQGFLETSFLWLHNEIENVQQFNLKNNKTTAFDATIENNPRLGKLVERFVSHQLQQDNSIDILVENIQIQDNKITLGELDCLLFQNSKPIHLEIIYKFYLYDATFSNTEINRWIGPNRRDSFHQKLSKLIDKQLPLLHHPKTKLLLDSFNLSSEEIKQHVYFKAQLFVPLKDYGKTFPLINNDCIEGVYISFKDISLYTDCKFYIPRKHNWLVKPYTSIDWLSYDDFKPNGELFKLFVVWW